MDKNFTGKSAIVTGATSGIGRAVALRFSEGGANVVAIGRNQKALDRLKDEITNLLVIKADVTNPEEMQGAVAHTIDTLGHLNVLVNAAGHISSGTIETTSLAAWDAMMNVNLRAAFNLMQIASPHLIESRGNNVNISSVTGLRSFPGVLAYCVSKAGVDHLTRCAAIEMAPLGVRVNAVNPGVTVTNLHRRGGMNETQYTAFLDRAKETHPIGRPGDPDEVASLIVYLASDKAGWMTGDPLPWTASSCESGRTKFSVKA